MSIYEELLSKGQIEKQELDSKIEGFLKKNPDLNKEIAAFFVAKELGIDIDDSKLIITPLNLLDENTKNANILVSVERVFPIKEFNSNNRKGRLQNVIVTDNTDRLQLTLWNPQTKVNQGDVILVTNVFVSLFKNKKKINTSKFSTIKIKDRQNERSYNEKELYEIQDKDFNLLVIGILKDKQELKEFEREGTKNKVIRFTVTEKGFKTLGVAWGKIADEIAKIDENTKIKIEGCYAKLNKGQIELHLNDYTKITTLEKNCQEYIVPKKNISELSYYEVSEIHAKVKSLVQSKYLKICKTCNNPMIKIDNRYFCPVCNSEQESFTKANCQLIIEDDSGNTVALLTKKILLQLLNCDEKELEEKLYKTNFESLPINCVGYLRKTKTGDSEFFVNYLSNT